ncbi:hypothetical protein LPJ66_005684 [Kickxella alabastrina]|uniref:Uncharacterized protein n=1 Tax=Kickxella alabastrina TaxID=61397 RepID=A0ACC1IHR6_9FUNG|nr:hypothetical protein LPJ66_005684 [Kickxella alabastrina]
MSLVTKLRASKGLCRIATFATNNITNSINTINSTRILLLSHRHSSAYSTNTDPVEIRRTQMQQPKHQMPSTSKDSNYRLSVASDISPTPTCIVRLSNLPPGTTPADIHCTIATRLYSAKIKAIYFEYDFNLRPLRSCRITFFSESDAAEFVLRANKMVYSAHTIHASFVIRRYVPNATRDKYLGSALGRLVLLYGYPPHMHHHQIRDYFSDYDLVETNIPAVQSAPQIGQTFLSRRGAFILQFATPSEARRFIRDVHLTEYSSRRENTGPEQTPSSAQQPADESSHGSVTIKAILFN